MKTSMSMNQSSNNVTVLLQIINHLMTEVHPQQPSKAITLDSHFEKDLGLDSLARVELISRIEKEFNLALAEKTFAEAQSPRDILRAIDNAETPRTRLPSLDTHPPGSETVERTPETANTLIDVLDWHVSTHPDRIHVQLYTDAGDGETLTYQQLKRNAMKVANGLQQQGITPTEPVVLMLPSGAD
ncbi:MAG: phosphopantetheine-binding protein, partial [Gammaproteobacteria bacterium]|nr:phosphopantetheine-binding protein [Gammaproteobacteria bacterium]